MFTGVLQEGYNRNQSRIVGDVSMEARGWSTVRKGNDAWNTSDLWKLESEETNSLLKSLSSEEPC